MSFSIRVIQPSNFLSLAAINLFNADVKSIIESDATIVLVDLSSITAISSASFIAVVKALQLVRASNRQLFLCSMNEQIRILFELTGLDQVFKTFANFDDFDQYIRTHGSFSEAPRQTKHLAQRDTLKLAS
ncbi:MAG: STAS domain-containing protein [Verrucomicrobia bacterium]|nr:STAS domain-containing protein [Leptolyngbya sp. ES-bin-22]